MKNTRYIYAVWRRKTSTAIIKLYENWTWKFNIIKWETTKSLKEFFGWHAYLIEDALYSFYVMWNKAIDNYDLDIVIRWGWLRGQAEAIRLGIARALVSSNDQLRTQLKPYGLLKRDPRKKERKKPWLRWARKAPEWSKR